MYAAGKRSTANTVFEAGEFSGRSRLPTLRFAESSSSRYHTASRYAARRGGMTYALFSWIPGLGGKKAEKSSSGGNSVSEWARKAKAGCMLAPTTAPKGQEIATFAGGCFWGLQLAFDRVPGVTQTTVGYTGGHDDSPTYNSVCSGRTGHAEAVQAYYDPHRVSYNELLDCFFLNVDPTTKNRQGGDIGTQYRSAIYYNSEEQKAAAEAKFAEVNAKLSQSAFRRVLGTKVVTELEPLRDYYVAERYHQNYLEKGGRFGRVQSAEKGCTDKIRCYG